MKKCVINILSLALAMILCLGLAGCGASDGNGDTAADTADTAAVSGESRQLTFTTTANSNENQGKFVQAFCDAVTELTGGSITFQIYYGGTLCGEEEELQYVQNGSVDMAAIAHTNFADDLTYLQFPYCIVGDVETLTDYYDHILFEDETTSALIEEEAAAAGVKLLGYMYPGQGAFVSAVEATSLEDLAGKKFGCVIPGAWEEYGVSVVNIVPPDVYDALSRGVIDASCCSLQPCYEMCWYEVGEYWILYGDVSVGNPLTINLDTWNSLSEEEQEAFRQAADEALQFSIDLSSEIEDDYIQDIQDRGCTVTFVSEEEQARYGSADFAMNARNALEYAEKNGKIESMKLIIAACGDYLGMDISELLAEY